MLQIKRWTGLVVVGLLVACSGDSADGKDGREGATVDDGAAGPIGAVGSNGSDGRNGIDGEPGVDGVIGADGADGDAGQGQPGEPGAPGTGFNLVVAGIATGPAGVLADTPVVLLLLGLDGDELAVLGAGQSADDGSYSIGIANFDAVRSNMMVRAWTPDGGLSALVTDSSQDVSVATDAVATWLRTVAGPELPITEFSALEISALVSDGGATLATAGTDLGDRAAVAAQLVMDLETDVNAAASARASLQGFVNPVLSDPPDVVTTIATFPLDRIDGDGELWDMGADGTIDDGTDDAYGSGSFELTVGSGSFPDQTENTARTTLEDGREAVLGPVLNHAGSGLDVTRKVYVPDDMGFVRFAEILDNPTGSDITLEVQIVYSLGALELDTSVFTTSDGNASIDPADSWLADHHNSENPAVASLFPAAQGSKDQDTIPYVWPSVTVPASTRVVLLHWAMQLTGSYPTGVQTLTDRLRQNGDIPPAAYFAGLSSAEVDASQLLSSTPLVGGAGLVGPGVAVAVRVNGGSPMTVIARPDGSLFTWLRASSGDAVNLMTDNGTSIDITVP